MLITLYAIKTKSRILDFYKIPNYTYIILLGFLNLNKKDDTSKKPDQSDKTPVPSSDKIPNKDSNEKPNKYSPEIENQKIKKAFDQLKDTIKIELKSGIGNDISYSKDALKNLQDVAEFTDHETQEIEKLLCIKLYHPFNFKEKNEIIISCLLNLMINIQYTHHFLLLEIQDNKIYINVDQLYDQALNNLELVFKNIELTDNQKQYLKQLLMKHTLIEYIIYNIESREDIVKQQLSGITCNDIHIEKKPEGLFWNGSLIFSNSDIRKHKIMSLIARIS